MEQFRINIRFDGLDADDHVIDMRLFGEAMIGLEKTLSAGLNALATGSVPPRSKLMLAIKATPPRDGCVQLDAVIELAQGVLPILKPALLAAGGAIAKHLISATIKRFGGSRGQSASEVEKVLDLMKVEKDDRQRERETLLGVIDRLRPAAVQMMAPVGRSAEQLTITSANDDDPTVFDVPMAQALRSRSDLEVSEMQPMRLKVDGITVHTRTLKVEDPNVPGRYVTAEVRDPAFTDGENVYTQSVTKMLDVQAKATYREGILHRIHIMDAKAAA
ncbi:hypothetical protein BZG35_14645 [Brevundimonas sp. LM2]|uniref:DUF7946 domain-containing protein n=1 Tax=Brevundimonas sp. LM2 TaxID=1938605 RepID=UPI000983A2AB|nr:hypothetical protein [Brevundimonas sp. LM2]AQR62750.1 hypothetical protein BZG35_14645 [Brevundimonas sp. LM2]